MATRLTKKQRDTKNLLKEAKNVGKPTVKSKGKSKGNPNVKPTGSTATKIVKTGGKALFGRFALAGAVLGFGGEYLYNKYKEYTGGYKPKVAPRVSSTNKNVRLSNQKVKVEQEVKSSRKSIRLPENNVKHPYSKGAKKGLQKTVTHASSLRLGQNDLNKKPINTVKSKPIFPSDELRNRAMGINTDDISTGSSAVKSKPTSDAVKKHANEFSAVTKASTTNVSKSQMRKNPKLGTKRRFKPSEVAGMNEGQTGSTGGPAVSTVHDSMKYPTPKSSPVMGVSDDFQDYSYGKKAKAPKPTSFDQKAANFLGVSFKTRIMKESKDPSTYGQMVPDEKAGVTAQPTGEGLDLFGGGKRRKKKAAGK